MVSDVSLVVFLSGHGARVSRGPGSVFRLSTHIRWWNCLRRGAVPVSHARTCSLYDGGISMSPLRCGIRVSGEETFHHLHACVFDRVNSFTNWRAGALSVKCCDFIPYPIDSPTDDSVLV